MKGEIELTIFGAPKPSCGHNSRPFAGRGRVRDDRSSLSRKSPSAEWRSFSGCRRSLRQRPSSAKPLLARIVERDAGFMNPAARCLSGNRHSCFGIDLECGPGPKRQIRGADTAGSRLAEDVVDLGFRYSGHNLVPDWRTWRGRGTLRYPDLGRSRSLGEDLTLSPQPALAPAQVH